MPILKNTEDTYKKMKIPIDINITNRRLAGEMIDFQPQNPETDVLDAKGYMEKTKNGLRLEFFETRGNEGVTTTICTLAEDTVSLSRVGGFNSHLVFIRNKSHTCICDTGIFPLQMRVFTKKLLNSLTLEGGKLDIDYTVEIVGNIAEKNRLTVSVSPDKSIIRS